MEDHGSQACLSHLLAHTVAIVNDIRIVGTDRFTGRKADSEQVGTGCPMSWDEQHFILSAGHVFKDAELKDLRFLTFANQPLQFKDPGNLRKHDLVDALPLSDRNAQIHPCEWEDLAVVSLNSDALPGVDYIDLRNNWHEPRTGEVVHCCGFPSDHSVFVERTVVGVREEVDVAVYPTVFGGKVQLTPSADDIKFKFDDFDPQKHYLVPYEINEMSQHPRGVSGAAMWWESDEKHVIWRPNFKFAGTCSHSHLNGRVVRVVRASVVRQFVEELFGITK